MADLMDRFEQYLEDAVKRYPEGQVCTAMTYSLCSGGKRIRPRLLFAALEDYGLDPELGFPAAAAIEMIHTYSLIHDDLPAMDDDDLRRGRPACHKAFGQANAILAGDGLQAAAFETICESPAAQNLPEMIRLLAAKAGPGGMVYGQDLDLHAQTDRNLEQLIEIEKYKTGCLLQLPLMEAALIAGRKEDLPAMESLGLDIGIQFQIQDDILDEISDPSVLGKTNSDRRNDKQTAVSVFGLEKARDLVAEYDRSIRQQIAGMFENPQALLSAVDLLLNRDH